MAEQLVVDQYPYLGHLRTQRENLGFDELDIVALVALSGSQNHELAIKARRTLKTKWDLEPEKDAKNAETVDLMDQFEQFSETERETIIRNMVGIQLTQGCNGNCPFCFLGKKKGVTAKYSYESIERFFDRYHQLFPEEMALYWDSDPFDYRDLEYTFVDIYKIYRKHFPNQFHFVSTAMPRGSVDGFVSFMQHVAIEQRENKKDGSNTTLTVRISLTKHNAQRVEATFATVIRKLSQSGFSPEEINDFFSVCVKVDSRVNNIYPLGALINSHDGIKDAASPACRDGTLLTPRTFESILITAPTIYEPSGQKNIDINPTNVQFSVPKRLRLEDYAFYFFDQSLLNRTDENWVMLDIAKNTKELPISLLDQVEDCVFKIGRMVALMSLALEDIQELDSNKNDNIKNKTTEQKQAFLLVFTEVFKKRRLHIQYLIDIASKMVKSDKLDSTEQEKIQFYLLLIETYLLKTNFVVSLIDAGEHVDTVSAFAGALRQVGKEQLGKLPLLMENLLLINDQSFVGTYTHKSDGDRIRELVDIKIGEPLGYFHVETGKRPRWLVKVSQAFVGKALDATVFSGNV